MLIGLGYARVAIIPLTLTPGEGWMFVVMFSIGELTRLGGVSLRTVRPYDEIQLPFTRTAGPGGSLGAPRRLRGQPPRASREQRGDK